MRSRQARSMREQLVDLVQDLERLEEEKAAAAQALKDSFDAAAAMGFDPATLKVVLRLRKMTPAQRREKRALEAIYLASLGMLEGDPLPDEARRRLDGQDTPPPPPPPPAPGAEASPAKPKGRAAQEAPPPPQRPLVLKDPEEARQEGRDAAAAGKRIYDNPFPAGDPCRAAWDEGWCAQSKSHGMEPPAAYQRRTEKPPGHDKDKDGGAGAGEAEKEGGA